MGSRTYKRLKSLAVLNKSIPSEVFDKTSSHTTDDFQLCVADLLDCGVNRKIGEGKCKILLGASWHQIPDFIDANSWMPNNLDNFFYFFTTRKLQFGLRNCFCKSISCADCWRDEELLERGSHLDVRSYTRSCSSFYLLWKFSRWCNVRVADIAFGDGTNINMLDFTPSLSCLDYF